MPVVLDNDAGERVLLYGADGGTLRKLVVDANGRAVVVGPGTGGAVTVTQTTPASLTTAIHGWDGAAWRKLPLLWGYSSRYLERVFTLTAAAGLNTLSGAVVPAGEVWCVTNVAASNQISAMTLLQVSVFDGATAPAIASVLAPAAQQSLDRQGWWVLTAGDRIQGNFFGCTLNDDLYLDILGYKMTVNE